MCQSQTQMFMDITGIDLFDQNVRMACAKVRIRCSWILLVLIFFYQNVFMACAIVRLRCSWTLLVLIYFIKMWVWYILKLCSDVYGYY